MRRTEKSGQEVIMTDINKHRAIIVRGKLGAETLEEEKEKEIKTCGIKWQRKHP